MSPRRRLWLLQLAGAACAPALAQSQPADPTTPAELDAVRRGRALRFPRDHGAHLAQATEWWYLTGWLGTETNPALGFQLTFFRSRTGYAQLNPSRFAARQLLFAHAAVVDVASGRHRHDQRIVRWNEADDAAAGAARSERGDVRIGTWSLRDVGPHWQAAIDADGFSLALQFARTRPLLLQGDAGFSRKGPVETQASHYYSEAQLAVSGRVVTAGKATAPLPGGRAWLDHEWSDTLLARAAVGWDWIGINLFDGSALTAFRLRRADGSALWAGGSVAAPGQPAQPFAADQVQFDAGRRWRSAASGASYPVQWDVVTPAGRWAVRALVDAQELDSRASTGTIYWEGLSELLDASGRRIGLGYLEMTGYAAPLQLG